MRELRVRLAQREQEIRAEQKKQRRDEKIHDHTIIRTYNYKRQEVKDHRTGKRASLQKVLAGNIELLR